MYIICDSCQEKSVVFVSNWNIIPVEVYQHNAQIRIGKLEDVSINPNTPFQIRPAPSVYRCRTCGFEKQYTTNEIVFN
jgi:hypothetical protein